MSKQQIYDSLLVSSKEEEQLITQALSYIKRHRKRKKAKALQLCLNLLDAFNKGIKFLTISIENTNNKLEKYMKQHDYNDLDVFLQANPIIIEEKDYKLYAQDVYNVLLQLETLRTGLQTLKDQVQFLIEKTLKEGTDMTLNDINALKRKFDDLNKKLINLIQPPTNIPEEVKH